MLNGSQITSLFIFKQRGQKNPDVEAYSNFSKLPAELIRYICEVGHDDKEFNTALKHAASAEDKDIAIVVEMVKANPRLLLQIGNVVTRGGVSVKYKKLYEFFLGEGDPYAAKQIEPYFAEIPDGENERIRQYERYRPHIETLEKQLKLNQPGYDLKPLFEIINNSPAADIEEALDINNPNPADTLLRAELDKFRNAVQQPDSKTVSMHYKHYTTLIQASELLLGKWDELSNNDTNYDKCDLIWRQIIGYLQLSLPAVDRFGFARCFNEKRTPIFEYSYFEGGTGSFPDTTSSVVKSGLGFDHAIYGCAIDASVFKGLFIAVSRRWKLHVENKLESLRALHPSQKPSGCMTP